MVDVKKDSASPAPADSQSTADVSAREKTGEEKNKIAATKGSFTTTHTISKGEKWFDWIVYRGLNYWVNLIGSVAIADYFIHLGGKDKLEKWAQKTAKFFPKGKDVEGALHNSRTSWKTAILCSGGWLLLIPLKLIEDRKRPIVHWINKKLGVEQTATDGHELTADEIYIEKEQPPMSWWKVVARRTAGFLAVVGAGAMINHAFRDQEKTAAYTTLHDKEEDLAGGKNLASRFVMKGANRIFTSGYVPGGKWLAKNPRAQAWMEFAVLDSIFTEITAAVMWVTRGAKPKHMPKEIEECVPASEVTTTLPANEGVVIKDRTDLKTKKPQMNGTYAELAQQKNTTLSMNP